MISLSDTTYMIPDVSIVHHELSDEGAILIIEGNGSIATHLVANSNRTDLSKTIHGSRKKTYRGKKEE